jgi:hypothetical protein
MSIWKRFRSWVNRDDGSQYQIGNKNLGGLEILGYFLLITALIIYLLHDKAGFSETWIGWLCLVVGFVLTVLGVPNEKISDENT